MSSIGEGNEQKDEQETEYEVEKIIYHVIKYKRNYYYYVKWKGYSDDENTWEPLHNLDGAPKLLQAHHEGMKKMSKENPAAFCALKKSADKAWRSFLKSKASLVVESTTSTSTPKSPPKCASTTPQPLTPVPAKSNGVQITMLRKRASQDDSDEAATPNKKMKTNNPFFNRWLAMSPKSPPSPSPDFEKKDDKNNNNHKNKTNDSINKNDDIRAKQLKALKEWEREMNEIDSAKIVVENQVDDEGPPKDFTYIADYRPLLPILFPDDPLLGCSCVECGGKNCCPGRNETSMAYNKRKRLRDPDLFSPIYECNRLCSCGPDCHNRVVQRGRKIPVCIFRTENNRGWGVKTLRDVKAGEYVMTYLGELISHEEAEARGKVYDESGMTYLFDLDLADDHVPGDEFYTIDAAKFGNVAHFVNHSCDPNMKIKNVFINNIHVKMPYLGLFACKDVKKGEELTFDYMMSLENDESFLDRSDDGEYQGNDQLSNSLYFADTSLDSSVYVTAPESSGVDENKTPTKKIIFSPVKNASVSNRASPTTGTSGATVFKAKTPRKRQACRCGSQKCRRFLN